MHSNPFLRSINQTLRNQTGPITEYDLLRSLKLNSADMGEDAPCGSDLALFRQHFLIMNALYTLRPQFLKEGLYLSISALAIELTPVTAPHNNLSDAPGEAELTHYYLNWEGFTESSHESVTALLNSFWQRYHSFEKRDSALETLGLSTHCSGDEIRKAFRTLAARYHPDRGGDSERFIQIREAYECLTCIYE